MSVLFGRARRDWVVLCNIATPLPDRYSRCAYEGDRDLVLTCFGVLGNKYAITNESRTKTARLFFAQGCEMEAMQVEEES
jgi:hypothetical protein